MVVRFRDGTEATVVRSFLSAMGDATFELWLPRDGRNGMAKMLPKLSKKEGYPDLSVFFAAKLVLVASW